eukprot:3664256-Pyramimonas_sp.AAC.1
MPLAARMKLGLVPDRAPIEIPDNDSCEPGAETMALTENELALAMGISAEGGSRDQYCADTQVEF